MQNLKYLEKIVDEQDRFGVVLNRFALKHQEHIQFKMALSLLEYFNGNKYISEEDVTKIDNIFYVSKEKYFKSNPVPKSRVFSIRVNIEDSEEAINQKITELHQKVKRYKNSNQDSN